MKRKVLLLAGEESGILYAERIRAEILRTCPDAEIRGYGDYGFATGDLAVFGIWEVLRRIGFFLRVKRTLQRAIDEWRPDVVCTIDYPGLNLKLAAYAKSKGVRAVHVVCPQVWAWKRGRIPRIEASLDRLCCFFPFEPALFRSGFAEFVGHPLVDEMAGDRGSGNGKRKTENGERVLAVLPGSRVGEIERHLPTLLDAVRRLQSSKPDLKIVIPAANDRAYAKITSILSRFPASGSQCLSITRGGAREALRKADAAVIASGTATLEAAIVGCPFVLVYRVSALLAAFLKRAITGVRHVGLVNVIAEKANEPCPMPELLQEAFTAGNVLAHLRPWLEDPAANAVARESLARTMRLLASDGGAISRIVGCLFGA